MPISPSAAAFALPAVTCISACKGHASHVRKPRPSKKLRVASSIFRAFFIGSAQVTPLNRLGRRLHAHKCVGSKLLKVQATGLNISCQLRNHLRQHLRNLALGVLHHGNVSLSEVALHRAVERLVMVSAALW